MHADRHNSHTKEVMKSVATATLISYLARTNTGFKTRFEEERARANERLKLPSELLSGETHEVIRMARILGKERNLLVSKIHKPREA